MVDPQVLPVPKRHPLRGFLLLLGALLLFACLDATIKTLGTRYNVPLIVAIRYIVHCGLMAAIIAPKEGAGLIRTKRTGMVLVRAACLMAMSLFMGLALQRMPQAEATSIQFLAPMLVVLLAKPFLNERIGWGRWLAVVCGFCGVLLVARPGTGIEFLGVCYVLCAVAAGAAYQLLSRILVATERTMAMLFYTALLGSLCFGAVLPWFWRGPHPTGLDLVLFLSMGATGGLGHFLFTQAYREAPASLLAPVNYLQLLWAGLLGWLVFGHIPDHLSIVGMLLIAASGIGVAMQSRGIKH